MVKNNHSLWEDKKTTISNEKLKSALMYSWALSNLPYILQVLPAFEFSNWFVSLQVTRAWLTWISGLVPTTRCGSEYCLNKQYIWKDELCYKQFWLKPFRSVLASLRESVSVRPSVCQSVRHTWVEFLKNGLHLNRIAPETWNKTFYKTIQIARTRLMSELCQTCFSQKEK